MRTIAILSLLGLVILLSLSCSGGEEGASGQQDVPEEQLAATRAAMDSMALTGVEKQLVEKLVELWRDRSNIASIDQAAAMLDVEVTDSMRVELLEKLRAHPELSKRLQVYGPFTVVLTNEEKRIGQYIIRYQKVNGEFPPVDSIVVVTGMAEEEVRDRLDFFVDVGFLYDLGGPDEYNPLGYSYGERMAEVIDNTGLHYHLFQVEGEEPYNVCCGKEAMFKLLQQYPTKKIHYETYDPWSGDQIVVEFSNGEVVSVTPEEAVFLEGGFCVANCMHVTRENARNYVNGLPFVQKHNIYSVPQRIELLKQELDEQQ